MRLAILDNGHRFTTRIFFAGMRAVSRLPVPDAVKVNRYRPDFYGLPMRKLTQEAMRGPSPWSVGDRELMGAVVSQTNKCEVCTTTHAGVAALAYSDDSKVAAVLANLDTAPIAEPLRETLRLLRKLTHARTVHPDDMGAALAAGVSCEEIQDALAVCFTFNVVDRLSRTFGFVVPSQEAFAAGARFLFARGYY